MSAIQIVHLTKLRKNYKVTKIENLGARQALRCSVGEIVSAGVVNCLSQFPDQVTLVIS